MKIELDLQTGSVGLTFGGSPAAIREVNPSSPYTNVVQTNMVLTGVVIPGVVEMTGEGMDGVFLVNLLKVHAEMEGRKLIHNGQTGNLTNEYYVPGFGASCKIEGHEAQMATLRIGPGQKIVAPLFT